jgi:hypothetical protein
MQIKTLLATFSLLSLLISCAENKAPDPVASAETMEKAKKDITGTGSLDASYLAIYDITISDTEFFAKTRLNPKTLDKDSKYQIALTPNKDTKGKYTINLANLSRPKEMVKIEFTHKETKVKSATKDQEVVNYADIGKDFVILSEVEVKLADKKDTVKKTILFFNDSSVTISYYEKADDKETRKDVATGTKKK